MFLKIVDIKPGDVLLCYSALTAKEDTARDTGYSHAAICIQEGTVLEASHAGVNLVQVESLLEDYDHIAVLGEGSDAEVWAPDRIMVLQSFASQVSGAHFNMIGLRRFDNRLENYHKTLFEKLDEYFSNGQPQVQSKRGVYFCSELIASAFIHAGIIDGSAAIVLRPEILSPSDIAKDRLFGFFKGYVKSNSDYTVPDNDYFQTLAG